MSIKESICGEIISGQTVCGGDYWTRNVKIRYMGEKNVTMVFNNVKINRQAQNFTQNLMNGSNFDKSSTEQTISGK